MSTLVPDVMAWRALASYWLYVAEDGLTVTFTNVTFTVSDIHESKGGWSYCSTT